MEYLGLEVSDSKLESTFRKFDKDKSGSIDYLEFRAMWIRLTDIREELVKREVPFPKNAKMKDLQLLLEKTLDEEDKVEIRALDEAKWWHDWQIEKIRRRKMGHRAKVRAQEELAAALDAAGQVYVLGSGSSGQFERPVMLPSELQCVLELWRLRTQPDDVPVPSVDTQEPLNPESMTDNRAVHSRSDLSRQKANNMVKLKEGKKKRPSKLSRFTFRLNKIFIQDRDDHNIEVAQIKIDAPKTAWQREYLRSTRFKGMNLMQNTIGLWGRRVTQGSMTESIAFAVTDSGKLYSWGKPIGTVDAYT